MKVHHIFLLVHLFFECSTFAFPHIAHLLYFLSFLVLSVELLEYFSSSLLYYWIICIVLFNPATFEFTIRSYSVLSAILFHCLFMLQFYITLSYLFEHVYLVPDEVDFLIFSLLTKIAQFFCLLQHLGFLGYFYS